jgi:hypothetical protein
MEDNIRAYIARFGPRWRPFLEKLADAVHPPDSSRPGWGPSDEAWMNLVDHLDSVAAAYVAWQSTGISINERGPVSDARLFELIEPCIFDEADRRVFLATCKQFVSD